MLAQAVPRAGNQEQRGVVPVVEDRLFVEPDALRRGVGQALLDAVADIARAEGAARLIILSDPNAAAFYERMGAVRIGDAPSDSIPGRTLPLFRLDL